MRYNFIAFDMAIVEKQRQVLAKMWKRWKPWILLVGMQNGVAIMKAMWSCAKLKIENTAWSSNTNSGYYPK